MNPQAPPFQPGGSTSYERTTRPRDLFAPTAPIVSRTAGATSQRAQDPRDVPLKAEEAMVGSIAWMRRREDCREMVCTVPGHQTDDICASELQGSGLYNHPVVILAIRRHRGSLSLRDMVCTVAVIYTWKDTTLKRYLECRGLLKFRNTMPIYHDNEPKSQEFLAAGTEFLHLSNDGALDRQSYVSFQHTYDLPLRSLRQLSYRQSRGYETRLSQESFTRLARYCNLTPQRYTSAAMLDTARQDRIVAMRAADASVGREA